MDANTLEAIKTVCGSVAAVLIVAAVMWAATRK